MWPFFVSDLPELWESHGRLSRGFMAVDEVITGNSEYSAG
jgi:hypothetical protein